MRRGAAVQSAVFPPAPATHAARNDDSEPGIAVDAAGTFFADGNVQGFAPTLEPRGTRAESGIDIWRSDDHGRSYRWIAAPFNAFGRLPGLGGDDADIGARHPNPASRCNVYAVSTDVGTTLLAISADAGTSWTVSAPGALSISPAATAEGTASGGRALPAEHSSPRRAMRGQAEH